MSWMREHVWTDHSSASIYNIIGSSEIVANIIIQFSRSVVSNSSRSHGLQHARSPCPSLTPGVYSNSCPLSQWCHPTISSSVVPFSFCLHLSLHKDLFKWVSSLHQVAKVLEFSASALVLPKNIQDWFSLGWRTGSPSCPRDSQESSPTPQFKSINSLVLSFLYGQILICICDYCKTIAWTRQTFVSKVMPLLFNMLSRLVISFLPGSSIF